MPTAKGGAYVRISSSYAVLLPSEKKIADYILKNSHRADELSIAEIAEHSGASNATVTRFCKRLGFNGFKDFRVSAIQDATGHVNDFEKITSQRLGSKSMTAEWICDSNAQACADTRLLMDDQQLAEAARIILSKKRVFLVGEGATACVASDLYQKLLRLGIPSIYSADRRMQRMYVSLCGPEDAVCAFDLSGNTRSTVEMAQTAVQNGAGVLAFCNTIGSPLARAGGLNFFGPGRIGSDITGTLAPRIAILCIVDCLFNALAQEMGDSCSESIKKTSQVIREDWI